MKNTIYQIISQKDYNPLKAKDFYYLLGADNADTRSQIDEALSSLEDDGELIRNARNKYVRCDSAARTFSGMFLSGKGGFGFVRLNVEPKKDDVYIAAKNTLGAQNHDIVTINIIRPASSGGKAEGRVIRITKKADRTRVGQIVHAGRSLIVRLTDGSEAKLEPNDESRALDEGILVRVELTDADENGHTFAKLLSVLGSEADERIELKTAIAHYNLPTEFSLGAQSQAKELAQNPPAIDFASRTDLRDITTFTIDSESAKDLDDAVSITETDDGYVLYVSIADVSYYVPEGSPIDIDARERGTSVYFPGTAIHMLPNVLCEQLCSLNAKEDKAAFTAKLTFDARGKLKESDFFRSVIRSDAKLAYDKVNRLLGGSVDGLPEIYAYLRSDLLAMSRLAEKLSEAASRRGSIELDLPEAALAVDEHYNVQGIELRERGVSERIIEQFMLAANTAVAEFIHGTGTPSLYRSHEDPEREKLVNFRETANLMGFRLRIREKHYAGELNKFLVSITKTPSEFILRRMLLRCMKKAEYSSEKPSHFALGFDYYTHFTSPIRRYPDLVVHRILSRLIGGTMDQEYLDYLAANISQLASDVSERERVAESAERECESMLCAKYMREHLGEEFSAIVSGVARSGLFVQLQNLVEGFVPFEYLDSDFYTVDMERLRLIGSHTGRIIHLGDRLIVVVEYADVLSGNIDFRVVRFEDN